MLDGFVDALLQLGGADAGLDFFEALLVDGPGEDGGGGGTVAGFVVGLAGDGLDEAGADVYGGIREFDGFGDGDSVFCYLGLAEGLVDQHVAAKDKMTGYPPGPRVTATA